jgi:sigma-E factor negative regulatory protein RseA
MSNNDVLSALMDDEAQDLELRRLLRDLPQQPQELERWHRYHLVREVFAGGRPHRVDLSAAVRVTLEREGETRSAVAAPRTWRRAAGSFAVAASVAALVLVGGQQLIGGADGDGSAIGALPTGVVNTRGAVPVQASFGNSAAVPQLQPADRTAYRELARQRLRRYSLEHAEHAALNTPAGMVPFARVPHIGDKELREQAGRQAQQEQSEQSEQAEQAEQ